MSYLHRNHVIVNHPVQRLTHQFPLVSATAAASRTRCWRLVSTTTGAHALPAATGIGTGVAALLVSAHGAGVGGLWLTAETTVGRRLFVVCSPRSIAAVIVVAGAG